MLHVGGCYDQGGGVVEGEEEESPACIRYLSRRCCVQVNKLTRRRASAIFFPINLNLLLTLFPYPTYPGPHGSPPLPSPLPSLSLPPLPSSPLAQDSLFPPRFTRSPPSPLCLYHRRVPSLFYSFLISSPFLRPFAFLLSFLWPSRGSFHGKKDRDDGIVPPVLRHVEPVSASMPD